MDKDRIKMKIATESFPFFANTAGFVLTKNPNGSRCDQFVRVRGKQGGIERSFYLINQITLVTATY